MPFTDLPPEQAHLQLGTTLVEKATGVEHEIVGFEDGQVWVKHPTSGNLKLGIDVVEQQFLARVDF